MQTEDGYIIRKCLKGEKEAFGLLVDKYREGVYLLAYGKLRNFQDAEDVTQEVFIKIYRKLHTLRRWDNVMAWVYAVTSNMCKDWIRSQSRRRDRESSRDQNSESLASISINAYRENLVLESLNEALDSLPQAYQQALTLHFLSGMKVMEIARLVGKSPSTIARRLRKAKEQLREEMLEMMSATYQQHKLPLGFTFRIVESVKHIRIRPIPRTTELPWGLTLATGIILTVLSLSPRLGLPVPMPATMSPSLSGEAKVLEIGEIVVDVLKISQIPAVARKNEDADFPHLQNAPALAPRGETTFADVSEEAGIEDDKHGYSAAFVDYDNDGDLDIYVSNWGWHGLKKPNKLYKNNGDGTFTDVGEEAGVVKQSGTAHTIFGDYDNDGDVDLYLVNGAGSPANVLYRNNGDGTFTNVAKEAGVRDFRDGKIGVFWDYNNDGHLDIYATTWGNGAEGSMLYKNNGDGTFTDVSRDVGAALPSGFHTAAVGDYDNDGDLDLFTPAPYRNNGDGTFTIVTKETKITWSDGKAGITLGDYNNDGHLDFCIVDDNEAKLYKSNGDGTFTDVAQKAGLKNPSQSRRPVFVDYDNDGYLDLYMIDNLLYHNNGDGTFTNVIEEAEAESAAVGVWFVFGAGLGDYDNDGDIDLYLPRAGNYNAVVGPSDELFRNNGNDNHWLHIKTVGTQSNRDGIGARVTVKAGDLSQIRDVVSEWSRSCPPVKFGLGENSIADVIEIKWPSGQVTTLNGVGANRMIEVTEGADGYKVLHRGKQVSVEPSDKQPATWGQVKQTELYQNYPNPFNPDTWIPYQLAQEEDVEIKLYSAAGQLVKTLDIGDRPAGIYTSKDKAAHWDGTNDKGEQVASGVFFYAIQAGDYTATKKMAVAR